MSAKLYALTRLDSITGYNKPEGRTVIPLVAQTFLGGTRRCRLYTGTNRRGPPGFLSNGSRCRIRERQGQAGEGERIKGETEKPTGGPALLGG